MGPLPTNAQDAGGAFSVKDWHVELFGGPAVSRAGHARVSRFETVRTALLLARLAYPPRRAHSREELIDLLWPDARVELGRNRLSQALSALRRETGIPLVADRHGAALPADRVSSDVEMFLAALARAKGAASDDRVRAGHLARALTLYAGEFMPGHFDEWTLQQRQYLEEARMQALYDLSSCRLRMGSPDEALSLARQAVAIDAWDDRPHEALMRALAAAGRPTAALRHFRDIETRWKEEADSPPRNLTDLAAAIRDGRFDAAAAPGDPAPPAGAAARASDNTPPLPSPITRFFGRQAEVKRITDFLRNGSVRSSTRLITLVGSGGSGKTRLALEAARRVLGSDPFGHAVYFVPLADADASVEGLATALRSVLSQRPGVEIPPGSDDLGAICAAIGQDAALVVLDNFDHLAGIDRVTSFLMRLLAALPELALLITSRQHLDVDGEQEIVVNPLAIASQEAVTPEALLQLPGIQLLVDRMQAVRPEFVLTAENAATIASLYNKLEGVPLAVVLCAAWAGTLAPGQMLDRLKNRFDLLVSRRKDIPERQRSLRATIEYSFQQLPRDVQEHFICLSVFRGSWTLEAAEAVGPATLTDLDLLRERSLIVAEEDLEGVMRYRMLESIRDYAQILSSDRQRFDAQERHIRYYVEFARLMAPLLDGRQLASILRRIQPEHDNLRAAMQRCVETRDIDSGLRIANGLRVFYEVRGFQNECVDWIDRLLALPDAQETVSPELAAATSLARASLLYYGGQYDNSIVEALRAIELFEGTGNIHGAAVAYNIVGNNSNYTGQTQRAREAYAEALDRARTTGDESLLARILANLGVCDVNESKWDSARRSFHEAFEVFNRLNLQRFMANTLNNLGVTAQRQKDFKAAREYFSRAAEVRAALDDTDAMAIVNLGYVSLQEGQETGNSALYQEARVYLKNALLIATKKWDRRTLGIALRTLGKLDGAEERWPQCVTRLAIADAVIEALRVKHPDYDTVEVEAVRTAAKAAMGEAGYEAATLAARRARIEDVVDEAIDDLSEADDSE